MKTIKQINDEIARFRNEIKSLQIENKETTSKAVIKSNKLSIKRKQQRINFLTKLLMYLETNPTVEYLEKERTRLERVITSLEEKYFDWSKYNAPVDIPIKQRKPFYNKEMGINKMKTQLTTINELLL